MVTARVILTLTPISCVVIRYSCVHPFARSCSDVLNIRQYPSSFQPFLFLCKGVRSYLGGFFGTTVLRWPQVSASPFPPSKDDDDDGNIDNISPAMKLQAMLVEQTSTFLALPPNAARLAWSTVLVAAVTIALGICCWSISAVETCFSDKLSRWLQNGVCVLVGALRPMLATSIALWRANAARVGNPGSATPDKRQGPAGVQWLSYWPMFAFFQVFLDPVLGWIPHYFSFKLVALAVLASPHTRGAYLITSRVIVGTDENAEIMNQVDVVVQGSDGDTTITTTTTATATTAAAPPPPPTTTADAAAIILSG